MKFCIIYEDDITISFHLNAHLIYEFIIKKICFGIHITCSIVNKFDGYFSFILSFITFVILDAATNRQT